MQSLGDYCIANGLWLYLSYKKKLPRWVFNRIPRLFYQLEDTDSKPIHLPPQFAHTSVCLHFSCHAASIPSKSLQSRGGGSVFYIGKHFKCHN